MLLKAAMLGTGHVPCGDLESTPVELLQEVWPPGDLRSPLWILSPLIRTVAWGQRLTHFSVNATQLLGGFARAALWPVGLPLSLLPNQSAAKCGLS